MAMKLHSPCPTCAGPAALAVCPDHGPAVLAIEITVAAGAFLACWNQDLLDALPAGQLATLKQTLETLARYVDLHLDLAVARMELARMRPPAKVSPPCPT
jgi:hypothetical protein